ncbi:MAG: M23 family metallopeptidase, partial [Synergistaceae bacterium]|nr:M23 family metallopeptidase [Synergistaceae bacterium]
KAEKTAETVKAASDNKPAPKKSVKAETPAPTPKTAAKKPEVKKQESPSKVIAQSAKPDKVLTAKRKSSQPDIPGLMDPIIVLSPNGDAANGPMRLVISGDKVEVIKLPASAAPKKPAPSDINTPFTSGYSYLSFYNAPGKPRNNIMTNLNSLNGKMMWPVDGRISSPFGKWRGKHKHEGIDIPMPGGTPIRAARNGVVIRTGNNSTIGFRGYGNFVMVDHGGSVRTFYAHCSRVAVVEGQRVMQGQVIGYVGSTGHSTANHLHFEVRINNTKVNPIPYLAGSSHLASNK